MFGHREFTLVGFTREWKPRLRRSFGLQRRDFERAFSNIREIIEKNKRKFFIQL
jgi:hypothetical protein